MFGELEGVLLGPMLKKLSMYATSPACAADCIGWRHQALKLPRASSWRAWARLLWFWGVHILSFTCLWGDSHWVGMKAARCKALVAYNLLAILSIVSAICRKEHCILILTRHVNSCCRCFWVKPNLRKKEMGASKSLLLTFPNSSAQPRRSRS